MRGVDYLYPIPGVAAVIMHKDQMCLVQRGQEPAAGSWTFPGGKLELGESIVDGLCREIREECQIEIRLVDANPLCIVEKIDIDHPVYPHHYIIFDYLCEYQSGTLRASSDVMDARWVGYDEVKKYTDNKKTLEVAELAWQRWVSMGF
ncbi:NUDIX hydrolase [Desulfurispira natronophila]|uniref:ADP-ribose pyrophosphatase YjhB (NUDIX family) n=1 Tax=Desulfurispira natronophila TaxID=682562 RepID=A0A7W7Y2Q2_9BACT|nr:NUDIX hydrolase [Desulfurispira natronophila]MBB5020983.1 ADP-ribose pyrophosphatase YjhB (NUDIX family) [Desulfurispira natronophila]